MLDFNTEINVLNMDYEYISDTHDLSTHVPWIKLLHSITLT